jgi:hypothetical protein
LEDFPLVIDFARPTSLILENNRIIGLADSAPEYLGVPWHTLYYDANYPRLQPIRTRWDPWNVFRHALSIWVG